MDDLHQVRAARERAGHAAADRRGGRSGRARPERNQSALQPLGTITDGPAAELLHGPADHWVEELVRFVRDLRFDTLLYWPVAGDPLDQLQRFARDVIPGVLGGLQS